MHVYNFNYEAGRGRGSPSEAYWGKSMRPYLKNKKRTGNRAQVVEGLPRKHETLHSNPSIAKNI
jgi:hypothetical protein